LLWSNLIHPLGLWRLHYARISYLVPKAVYYIPTWDSLSVIWVTHRGIPSPLVFFGSAQRPICPNARHLNCWSRPFHPVLSNTPPSPFGCGSISRLPQLRLSHRQRQPGEPPEHTAKQPLRQMALCQQKPVVAGMFHQQSTRLHQPLPQTRQRPVLDSLGQRQPPPIVLLLFLMAFSDLVTTEVHIRRFCQ